MKTTKLILLLASILLLSACSTKDVEPEYFNIDATEASMPDSKAGSTDILLATNCNPTVTVEESAAGWLSAAITRRCLTLTCTENPDPEERTGKALVVAGSTQVSITVTQPGHVDEPDEPEEPEDPDEPATSYELYDVYYENGQAVGIVFWAAEDNLSALVVSLDRSEIVPWSYDGTHTIGTGTSDGAANTELLRASEEAAEIPALAFCDQHGEGWYWPSLGELQTLFEAYNGTTYEYMLAPLWISGYKYRKKDYGFVVNGRNGKVVGKSPVSVVRAFIATVLGLAALAGIGYLIYYLFFM